MARDIAINDALEAELDTLRGQGAPESLLSGVLSMLGAGPGEALTAEFYPVFGFHISASAEQFLVYAVTPGRFCRYEVVNGRSLTVTVPIERVSRVVEAVDAAGLLVMIELDADFTASVSESSPTEASPTRTVGRVTRTMYELRAGDEVSIAALAAYSRALRNAIGL
jgi:hypothetical protein